MKGPSPVVWFPVAVDAGDRPQFERAMRWVSALGPGLFAVFGAVGAAPASHDVGVVRTVGLGGAGVFHALEALVTAPFMLVPVGTRALRAGLAGAGVTAFAGAILFTLALRMTTLAVNALSKKRGETKAVDRRLLAAVACVVTLAALLGPAWQVEAAAPGSATIGALLVLLALSCVWRDESPKTALAAFVLGLSMSTEPATFASSLGALVLWLHDIRRERAQWRDSAIAFVLGLTPLGLGFAISKRLFGMGAPLARGIEWRGPRAWIDFSSSVLGTPLLVAATIGIVLVAIVASLRRELASLLLVFAAGIVSFALGLSSSDASRVSSPVLASVAVAYVLAGVTLAAIVVAVARARVPFAKASAALLVVLELVLPVHALDDTQTRRELRASRASVEWNEAFWGPLPPGSVLLVTHAPTLWRIAAAQATGEMRGDALVVPMLDVTARATRRALLREPKLAPVFRDIALGTTPEELSLSTLAGEHPVITSFDPRWDRALARHFLPVGLMTRYESEPRGASDRRRALETFGPEKDRLVRVTVARKDPELLTITAALLRTRAITMAACGEKDVLSRALDDLRPFAPEDPVAATLVRRIVTTKGPIEVKDLGP